MKVAIIDYGAGNTQSVKTALERLGAEVVISHKPEELYTSHSVIFPGVGHAKFAMNALKEKGLDRLIPQLNVPVLGICLGFQLMCASSEEGNQAGLGIFSSPVKAFPKMEGIKIPHMGWNSVKSNPQSLLFKGIEQASFYHVHRYYAQLNEQSSSSCLHGIEFMSSAESGTFYGVQFHPEKSGVSGQQLLDNFLSISKT